MDSFPENLNQGGWGDELRGTTGNGGNAGIKVVALRDDPDLESDLEDAGNLLTGTAEPIPHMVLEFGAVTYVASSHLAQMLRIRKKLNDARKQLAVCGMNDHVWSVLALTGLDRVFRSYPSTAAALAALSAVDGASA